MTEDELIQEMAKVISAHLARLTPEERELALKRADEVIAKVLERRQYH